MGVQNVVLSDLLFNVTESSAYSSVFYYFLRRYVMNDSAPIMAYGFVNANNGETSSLKNEAGHSYYCVPQVNFYPDLFNARIMPLIWSSWYIGFNSLEAYVLIISLNNYGLHRLS